MTARVSATGAGAGHLLHFDLRLATPADSSAIARVCAAAYGSNAISRGLYGPTGQSGFAQAAMQAGLENDLQGTIDDLRVQHVVAEITLNPSWSNSTVTTTNHAVRKDEEAGEANKKVIGFAKWLFFPTAESLEGLKPPLAISQASLGEGTNLDMAEAFFGGCHELRQRHIRGRPHCILSILTVDPERQGLGAGSALVRWGIERADSAGLDCWLTGTPVGYPIYHKCGFADVDVLDLEMGLRWGVKKSQRGENWGEELALAIGGPVQTGCFRMVLMRKRAQDGNAEIDAATGED